MSYRVPAEPIEDCGEIRIASFGTPHEAQLARAYLESQGISCRLTDEMLVGTALAFESALGGVKLHVSTVDAARAHQLLESYRRGLRKPLRPETADERVRRALRATVAAFVIFPVGLHLFSEWLLLGLPYRRLSDKQRRLYWLAHALNWAVIAAAVVLVLRQ